MAVNTSNNVRVDLQEIFDNCMHTSSKHSRNYKKNEEHQEIVICEDDYGLLFPWMMEAAVLIADACNYITSASQTPLDAISNPYPTEDDPTNPYDELEVKKLTQAQKQTGELLSKAVMDELQFNVTGAQNQLDYTITQQMIRAAIIEYLLYRWYELNKIMDAMQLKKHQFDFWLGQLQTNSLNNQKAIEVRKPYRLF
jgi:hypothetical protein